MKVFDQTHSENRIMAETKKAEYLVEYQDKEPGEWNRAQPGATFENAAKAVAWIKANGVNKTYRVVRVVAGPFVVQTQTVTKRTLQE